MGVMKQSRVCRRICRVSGRNTAQVKPSQTKIISLQVIPLLCGMCRCGPLLRAIKQEIYAAESARPLTCQSFEKFYADIKGH
jgi:hypothetical protein